MLAPAASLLLLRAPLISALPYRDPWFYSGYGWTLSHHVEIFGWFYYAVRFPAILAISWSTALFGPVAGYVLLRYFILAATGALLYRCVRRFASVGVACAGVVLLTLNPFYLRMVLWDYTTFVSLPCTIAGVAVWYLGSTERKAMWTAAASGGFISAAVFANPLSGLVIPVLYGVEGISALRRRQSLAFLARLSAAVAAAIAVFAGGYLSYRAYLGSFSPWELIRPTLEFAQSVNTAAFQHPPSLWLKEEPRIYAPVLICVGVVVVLGRGLLDDTRRARVAQFAVGYTAAFWIYRFAFASAVIETWWAYNMTAVTGAFGLPVILDELVRGTARKRAAVLSVGAVLAVGLVDLLIRSLGSTAVSFYNYLRWHPAALLAVLIGSCLTALALTLSRLASLRLAALVALFGLIALIALTPAGYLGIKQTGEFSPYGSAEVDAYRAAYDMSHMIAVYDRSPSRVLLWTNLYGLADIGWANLPHQNGGIENPETTSTPLPQLTPSEIEMLTYPTTTRILAISDSSGEVASAAPALAAEGLKPVRVKAGTWADGKLHYELIGIGAAR